MRSFAGLPKLSKVQSPNPDAQPHERGHVICVYLLTIDVNDQRTSRMSDRQKTVQSRGGLRKRIKSMTTSTRQDIYNIVTVN